VDRAELAGAAAGGLSLRRGFVALPLPESHRAGLAPFVAAVASTAPGFRWVPAGNLHLTLRFLGPVESEPLARLSEELARVEGEPFDLELGQLGSFWRRGKAAVLWLGLAAGAVEAKRLAAAVEAACRASGLAPDERPYRAHITLARPRTRAGEAVPDLPAPPALGPWLADEFVLFESHTGRGGAVYEQVARYALQSR
jgi:2'-5' RNA ligase